MPSSDKALAEPYWVEEMKAVHSIFSGTPGNIARFGDSITYSSASFKPLRYDFTNRTPEDAFAQEWLQSYITPVSWTWQDDAVAESNGNYSSKTAAWPLQTDQNPPMTNIQHWLQKLKPELAVVMWGTNDLSSYDVTTYTNNMRQTLQAIKDNGTIPLLSTIPPRRNYESKSALFAQAMRDLSAELLIPLIDFNQEILTRQPGTAWDGTLISNDGVHPSYNKSTSMDFSESTLNSNGYVLRNYLSLHGLFEIYNEILNPRLPGDFNGDEIVDDSDLPYWQAGYGLDASGDADNDNDTDGKDFLIWQRNVQSGPSTALTAIPEPSTAIVGIIYAIGILARRSFRERRTTTFISKQITRFSCVDFLSD
ncbi:SGNH/GDSL hydrolase family protein [Bythopirellula goksoeyrii]|nr:SGNH/GDSL hydrolase family protein [Bythopirellula goksoeyrii]